MHLNCELIFEAQEQAKAFGDAFGGIVLACLRQLELSRSPLLPSVTDYHQLKHASPALFPYTLTHAAGARQMPGRRILLVEDDPDVTRILEHVLFDEGYDVDVAKTIKDA